MFSSTSILLSYWYKLQIHWSDTSEGLIIYWKFHIQPKKKVPHIYYDTFLFTKLVYSYDFSMSFLVLWLESLYLIYALLRCGLFLFVFIQLCTFWLCKMSWGVFIIIFFFDKRLEGYSIIWPLKSMRHDIVV